MLALGKAIHEFLYLCQYFWMCLHIIHIICSIKGMTNHSLTNNTKGTGLTEPPAQIIKWVLICKDNFKNLYKLGKRTVVPNCCIYPSQVYLYLLPRSKLKTEILVYSLRCASRK